MRRLSDAFPVIVTLFLALFLTVHGGYDFMSDIFVLKPDKTEEETLSQNKEDQAVNSDAGEADKDNTEDNSSSQVESSSDQTSSAIEASTSGSALGKIVKQTISPYSAKLSYNNVYIKNNSGLTVDLKSELEAGVSIKIKKSSEPQVLILHTHGTECYMNEDRDYYTSADLTRTDDNTKNVIRIGDIVANKLKEAGIGVIHDTTQHDNPSYNASYSRAAVTITQYLKKYPSIKIVIDIHRDSIALNDTDRVKTVKTINSKDAAQVMLCMGSQSGTVKNFPNWKQNFRLAAKFHQTIEAMYPGLARPMLLASKNYNESLTTGSMLLEIGTESNLLSEAEYSAELVGNALVNLLNTLR